jgi:hypothetical protein
MDVIDYRAHYALMLAEDRIRDLHREADRDRLLESVRRQSGPRRGGRQRWSVADLVGLLVPRREVKPRNPTTSPKPL